MYLGTHGCTVRSEYLGTRSCTVQSNSVGGTLMITASAVALASAILVAHPGLAPLSAAGTDTVRVVLVLDDSSAHRSLMRGAVLGAEEAEHTGALFGTPLTLRVVTRAAFDSARSGTTGWTPRGPSVYVVAGDSVVCSEVAQRSGATATPVLDAGCPAASGAPAPTVFSLDARDGSAVASDSTHLALWHSSLERFGAEQLNERFRRRFNAAMDSEAWVGWFAMKVALDLALHAHSATSTALLHQLADPHATFDGQKGRPLRFDATTHRLIQPLYRIVGSGDSERVVTEVAP